MTQSFEIINLPLAYLLLALLALAIGSFLNVIIYRLPHMLYAEWNDYFNKNYTINKRINLFFPRSFCPSCKIMIPARNNIPVLSFCLLRGRCQACQQPISPLYPLIEITSCLFALFSATHFGFNLTLLATLFFIWILIALFFIDLKHQLLPDSLTLSLLWSGLIANTQSLFAPLPEAVISSALAYLFLWLFMQIFYLLTGKKGMGNGDFKLFAAFGAWFGWTQLPIILLVASFTGAIIGFIYLKIQGKSTDTPIPFGPFLCFAGLISLFWGKMIIGWYFTYCF
ncbi:prepilin peptidase [Legionella fairfieldensis]|uniref:prepilin peptidase n=1 Tax=Legionella fairfieldensis TaxID=45064 RepID=UPI00048A9B65|nr:A24 family peptidase [Legionella fairfieldensis]